MNILAETTVPSDLAGIPLQYQLYATYVLIACKYLAELYGSVRNGGGLKRIIMSFWLGEGVPKVISDDYKAELSQPPFPKKPE